ncbi:MAG: DNA glycosylase, partial [Oscillospiraceae bacterium]
MSAMMMPAIFDLEETLDCGQAFRWEEKDGHWQGFALGRYLQIERQGDNLAFHCSPEDFREIWGHYFDLDTDYTQIRGELSAMSPILKEAVAFAPGIHILNQDPWEALCSFILSQNNNIKRIKGIVARLCTCFGEPIPGGFAFPTPQALAACTPE